MHLQVASSVDSVQSTAVVLWKWLRMGTMVISKCEITESIL